MSGNCGSCKFYQRNICRRFPPTVIKPNKDSIEMSLWPTVDEIAWCGEWAAKEK